MSGIQLLDQSVDEYVVGLLLGFQSQINLYYIDGYYILFKLVDNKSNNIYVEYCNLILLAWSMHGHQRCNGRPMHALTV